MNVVWYWLNIGVILLFVIICRINLFEQCNFTSIEKYCVESEPIVK